ncbi:MAG: hypothetical protein JST52_03390 [Bacteroidetes bacterium]|nr:hypothetical protein [Bacteroidota bacterium]MBS1738899.1 hypothetical protein [Bacteroidota bacterium]MBS1776588.1 hypothetical protein [Bacteroidota bacterium]
MNTKFLFALSLTSVLFFSCKSSKEKLITRKWQAARIESPELDQQIASSRIFFDTVGKSTDAATNEQLYGARNMDSLRVELKNQLDSFIAMQQETVLHTWLHFLKNGTVAVSFNTPVDTVKWYFDDDGNLMLDEMQQKGAGDKIKMEVLDLSDTLLQLRFTENGFSSTAFFHPATP